MTTLASASFDTRLSVIDSDTRFANAHWMPDIPRAFQKYPCAARPSKCEGTNAATLARLPRRPNRETRVLPVRSSRRTCAEFDAKSGLDHAERLAAVMQDGGLTGVMV